MCYGANKQNEDGSAPQFYKNGAENIKNNLYGKIYQNIVDNCI